MPKGVYKLPNITNEPIKSYAPGSPERAALKEKLNEIHNQVVDIPMIIGGKEIRTDKLADIRPPHDHQHLLGHYHQGDASHVQLAIDAAMKAKPAWEKMNWESRAAIFLKAAEYAKEPPEHCLVLEDSEAGVQAAYAAGIDVICIPDLKQPSKEYKEKATAVMDSLDEVIGWLDLTNLSK